MPLQFRFRISDSKFGISNLFQFFPRTKRFHPKTYFFHSAAQNLFATILSLVYFCTKSNNDTNSSRPCGLQMKEFLEASLRSENFLVNDLGTFSDGYSGTCDYAHQLAQFINNQHAERAFCCVEVQMV